MADRTQARVANHNDIASDDPFAELTRIMGFDPREPVQRQPAQQASAELSDDFDIDLEKELMGEFSGHEAEPAMAAAPQPLPAIAPVAAFADEAIDNDMVASMEEEFRAEAHAPLAAAPAEAEASDFEFAAADEMEEPVFDAAVTHSLEQEFQPQAGFAPVVDEAEDFDLAMRDIDFGDMELDHEPVAEPMAVAAEPVAAAPEDFDAHFDTAMADVDMDFNARLSPVHEAANADVAVAEEDHAPAQAEQSFLPTFGHHTQPADNVATGADFDIDMDDVFTDEAHAEPVAFAAAAAQPEVAPAAANEASAAAAQDRSLEDELNALLGRMTARPAVAEPAAETWRPQLAAAPVVEEPALDADLDASLIEELSAAEVDDAHNTYEQAAEEPLLADDEIDFDVDAFDAAMAKGLDTLDDEPVQKAEEEDPVEALRWAAPAVAAAAATASFVQPIKAWGRGNPVAPGQQYSAPVQQYAAPVQQYAAPTQQYAAPTQRYGAPVEPVMETLPSMPLQPAMQAVASTPSWHKPAQPATIREDVPDIETMDVPERVVALADDLDIPEVPFEQDKPESAAYDELDAEFSTLLNEMVPNTQASAKVAHYDDEADGHRRDRVEMPAYADTPQAAAAAAAYADLGYQGYDPQSPARGKPAAGAVADDGFDYDPDLEEAMSIPEAAAAGAAQEPRRRGLLIAAVVGAVAVVGGVGAFALSFGGSSSEAPAIVKADNQPMKVKPENPGGAVIPNQDNKVYDAVAKGARPAVPTQPKLVANAEVPVDVVAKEQADRAASLSGPDDSENGALAPAQDANAQPAAKGEDRVAQVAQENAGTQEGALVTPRKVRTMVVKPDGSLAPREEPVAAPVAASEPTDPTPQRVAQQDQTGTVPQATDGDAPQAALKPAAKPQAVAKTPAAAPVAPQRPSDQPVNIAGEVKPKADQQVASAQPQAPAPAAGGWSMQIASQPTVEGAQSTYQDLARRYSSVLAGRSANIVKAEVAGKGTFYRVRVMAQSRDDAVKLCTSYKAAGGNCFVSK
ncbi:MULTISPECIES: SPOR domain-containing protein [Phyllobacteriaceae]|jgi:SPOR domain|uniref:SPOR domain-containing protein n=1 Tax=Mesorhizobium hungaricum TaxID=1566387 RepID=A0A1C2DN49_9HYPH|nr:MULTISPECIES: SPOR domain-containing protein [Mesorhizobium]MBN9237850.1 SPOR domain-containing protein [Mesorhizobium sp.]MDQ0328268.1 hypothetical protein [Mesorhizobium sp. YL-MeA3-2017]OCX16198.1 hypothetical protein QV13_15185 [Mesorhizobium hungaricum]